MNQNITNNSYNPQKPLSRTWMFRLLCIAWVSFFTPYISVSIHGMAGFLVMLFIALSVGLIENSLGRVTRLLFKGLFRDKIPVLFALWYIFGFIINLFIGGRGINDWRLIMDPLLILLGMCFSYAFMDDNICYRFFIILFIIFSGVQALFSMSILASKVDIAREMYVQTNGAWIYGNQIIYAIYAIVIPVLFYYSIRQKGLLKLGFFALCVFILIVCAISSFGTPLGLILIGISVISLSAIFLLFKTKPSFGVLLIVGTIIMVVLIGYKYFNSSPLITSASTRINTALIDPTSGGYVIGSGGISRWFLAEDSIKSFESSPLFGVGGIATNNPLVGGHSSFFDSLGLYGLFGGGGALIGIILIIFIKTTLRFFRERNWETLLTLTSVILLVVAGVVNPYWGGPLAIVLIMVRPFLKSVKKQKPILSPTLSMQPQKYFSFKK
jgi:hypothetical protein